MVQVALMQTISKKWFLVLIPMIVWGGYMSLPRGIRNNNPGNIRHGDNWVGMADTQKDKSFVTFVDAKYGIRAMVKVFRSYRNRGVVTLGGIISTWAPSNENDTEAYIKAAEKSTGWSRSHVVAESEGDYQTLIKAIIKRENGAAYAEYYSLSKIDEGIALA